MVGDTVGKPGRRACREIIPRLRETEFLDFVIVNGENSAGGSSITQETVREIFDCGVDVVTSGDHVYKNKEAAAILELNPRVLRPVNYPRQNPGRGMVVATNAHGVKVAVINVMGRVFLQGMDCPFRAVEAAVNAARGETPVILVDMHAEATSEKVAMGWFLDGRASAVAGTHTHIQTADERVLPKGTAYITDLGMTGPYESVLGRDIQQIINKFLTQIPARTEVASGDIRLCGAIVEIDVSTGKSLSIKRVCERL